MANTNPRGNSPSDGGAVPDTAPARPISAEPARTTQSLLFDLKALGLDAATNERVGTAMAKTLLKELASHDAGFDRGHPLLDHVILAGKFIAEAKVGAHEAVRPRRELYGIAIRARSAIEHGSFEKDLIRDALVLTDLG